MTVVVAMKFYTKGAAANKTKKQKGGNTYEKQKSIQHYLKRNQISSGYA